MKLTNKALQQRANALMGCGPDDLFEALCAVRDTFTKDVRPVFSALHMYADPESYHAMVIFGDKPTGGFGDDFGDPEEHGHYHYDRPMPGKAARTALHGWAETETFKALEADYVDEEEDAAVTDTGDGEHTSHLLKVLAPEGED